MKFLLLTLLFFTNTASAAFFTSDIENQSSTNKNVISNSGAENGTAGWANTGSGTLVIESTITGDGTSSFKWDAAVAADKLTSNAGVIPGTIQGTLCIAEMYYQGAGTADITMRVLNGSDVLVAGSEATVTTAATKFRRIFSEFICPSSGSLKFQLESAGNAAVVYVDEVFVGVKSLSRGALVGDTTIVPMLNADIGTILSNSAGLTIVDTTSKLTWQRVGNSVTFSFHLSVIGDGTSPSAFSIKRAWIESQIGGTLDLGAGLGGANVDYQFVPLVLFPDAGAVEKTGFWHIGTNQFYVDNFNGTLKGTNIGDVTGTDFKHFAIGSVTFPVLEWAGQGTVNLLNSSVINSNARFETKGLLSLPTITNASTTTISVWDNSNSDPNFDGTIYTIPADGTYRVHAYTQFNSSAMTAGLVISYIQADLGAGLINLGQTRTSTSGGSHFGVSSSSIAEFSKGDTIQISIYQNSGSSQALDDDAEDAQFSVTRIPDVTSESAFGFGLADSENAGLVLPKNMAGTNTNDDADAGSIGEYISHTRTSTFSTTSPVLSTWYDVTSHEIELTAGDWDIHFQGPVQGQWSSGGQLAFANAGIRTGSTVVAEATAVSVGDDSALWYVPRAAVGGVSISARVSIASTTTYKVSIRVVSGSGTPVMSNIKMPSLTTNSTISARRVR